MSETPPPTPGNEVQGAGYERRDVRSLALIKGMIAIMIVGLIIHVVIAIMLYYFHLRNVKSDVPASPLMVAVQTPPEPRLQASPAEDLARMRRDEAVLLDSYDWVNRPMGIVRIPVDEALSIVTGRVAQKGLPTWPVVTTTTGTATSTSTLTNVPQPTATAK